MNIVPLALSDLELVRRLHFEIYGWTKNKDEFESMYVDSQGDLKAVGYLAKNERGEAAAYYGVFLCDLRVDGKFFFSAQSGDTMTHPDFQGKGLFTKLALKTYDKVRELGVDFVYGFPNESSYPGFKRKLNWNFPFKMKKAIRVVPCLPFGLGGDLFGMIDLAVLEAAGFRDIAEDTFGRANAIKGDCFAIFPDRTFEKKKYYIYESNGASILIKLDRLKIYIGFMNAEEESGYKMLFDKVFWVAFLTGRPALITYLSSWCHEFDFIKSKFKVSESLNFGYLGFDNNFSDHFNTLRIRYVDYDTF
ncbi:GNAT family N-acetyltransferase [Alcanivorax sp.]|uniref:GNAT family N-acetyltransferase n=1 Tax=Alcanivorax sp. TaxID=1872427 RepID=UPI0025C15812|nr:GNAT family N-acetyltransferase [Alcanivorax sp.]